VPDKRRNVQRNSVVLHLAEKFTDIQGRATAISHHEGSDAHAQKILRPRLISDFIRMRVHIDKARRNDQSRCINLGLRPTLDVTDPRDATILDRNIRMEGGIAITIDDLAVTNNEVELFRARQRPKTQ